MCLLFICREGAESSLQRMYDRLVTYTHPPRSHMSVRAVMYAVRAVVNAVCAVVHAVRAIVYAVRPKVKAVRAIVYAVRPKVNAVRSVGLPYLVIIPVGDKKEIIKNT